MDRSGNKHKNKKRGRSAQASFEKDAPASSSQSNKTAQPGYEVIPGTDHINAATDVRKTHLAIEESGI